MTEQDMKQLQEWQESPEGTLFHAIRNIDISMKDIESNLRKREGVKFLRESAPELMDLIERLQAVHYAVTFNALQAAE